MIISLREILEEIGDPEGTASGFTGIPLRCEVCLVKQTFSSLHPTTSGFWRCCEHLYGMGFDSPAEFFTWLFNRPANTPTIWEMNTHYRMKPPVRYRFSFPYREVKLLAWVRSNWFGILMTFYIICIATVTALRVSGTI